MTPDSALYNPAPEYIRGVIAAIPLTQREVARRIGVSTRYVRALVAGSRVCSYPVQFCLEALAAMGRGDRPVTPTRFTPD